jgi:hypothetical protein
VSISSGIAPNVSARLRLPKEAIEKAAKEFDIPPARQNRIVVEKVKGKD